LKVESEIAKGIAESLQAKLTGHEEQALAVKQQTIRRLMTRICAAWLLKRATILLLSRSHAESHGFLRAGGAA